MTTEVPIINMAEGIKCFQKAQNLFTEKLRSHTIHQPFFCAALESDNREQCT